MPDKHVRLRRQSSVAGATTNGDWVDGELADCIFKDERLGKRFRLRLQQMGANPGGSIPLVCQDWAGTKAAYRFLDNDRVEEAEILAGHFGATQDRCAATAGPILVLHDTTEFVYKRDDIGAIGITRKAVAGKYRDGKLRHYTTCGILMHSSLAVTTEGLPLGLSAVKFWTRSKFKGTNALKRTINRTRYWLNRNVVSTLEIVRATSMNCSARPRMQEPIFCCAPALIVSRATANIRSLLRWPRPLARDCIVSRCKIPEVRFR